jgi:hypothetical protein
MAVIRRVPALRSVVLAVAMTAVTMATTDDEHQRAASPASPMQPQRPNLLWIIADDFGYNDIGYHNANNEAIIRTPHLDLLASSGVKLENAFSQPICTPTRSQALSGRHQIHTGLQHGVIWPFQPNGLPLNETIIAAQLQHLGFAPMRSASVRRSQLYAISLSAALLPGSSWPCLRCHCWPNLIVVREQGMSGTTPSAMSPRGVVLTASSASGAVRRAISRTLATSVRMRLTRRTSTTTSACRFRTMGDLCCQSIVA